MAMVNTHTLSWMNPTRVSWPSGLRTNLQVTGLTCQGFEPHLFAIMLL